MVFSSLIFLHFFLPLMLAAYFLVPARFVRLRNGVLLVFSLIFYAWGEPQLVIGMVALIAVVWIAGILLSNGEAETQSGEGNGKSAGRKWVLAVTVVLCLGFLGYFKYANFALNNVAAIAQWLGIDATRLRDVAEISLPLGISFYTFQALSYIIDVYRGTAVATRRFDQLACYISMFPQLVAGPIVRYNQISAELVKRSNERSQFAAGARRFVVGLAKKVLLANIIAQAADAIFNMPPNQLSTAVAWWGIAAYTLQIYFDFSAYSDMAIGIGLMLGFHFPENFNYPYISKSIREFWQRWHISLSTWLRDYLYIPLGGNRAGQRRTYLNLWIVFLLCGLWHGASWNFVLWGGWHGLFLVIERAGFERVLQRTPHVFRHGYALLVVMTGWIVFRSEDMSQAWLYTRALLGDPGSYAYARSFSEFASAPVLLSMIVGVVAATGLPVVAFTRLKQQWQPRQGGFNPCYTLLQASLLVWGGLVMFLSMIHLYNGAYNPFIYFRF